MNLENTRIVDPATDDNTAQKRSNFYAAQQRLE